MSRHCLESHLASTIALVSTWCNYEYPSGLRSTLSSHPSACLKPPQRQRLLAYREHCFPAMDAESEVNPSHVMMLASSAVGLCIITGALASTDWGPTPSEEVAVIGGVIGVVYLWIIPFSIHECSRSASIDPGALFSSTFLAASTCVAYCIVTTGWRNIFHYLLYVMVSILAGAAFELSTGLFSGFLGIGRRSRVAGALQSEAQRERTHDASEKAPAIVGS